MTTALRSAAVRHNLSIAGDIVDYVDWQQRRFGSSEIMPTRTVLWKMLSKRMRASGDEWHVIEFGVAFGHASFWWLRHHDKSVIATWDGFDCFTGLPQAWRQWPAGAFDAGGKTPRLHDDRITWHVGDVEETIFKMEAGRIASGRRLVLFDLDLYEPTKIAWDWVHPRLRSGDLLFFDEAFDGNERRLIDEEVLPAGSFSRLGSTSLGLAIEVLSVK